MKGSALLPSTKINLCCLCGVALCAWERPCPVPGWHVTPWWCPISAGSCFVSPALNLILFQPPCDQTSVLISSTPKTENFSWIVIIHSWPSKRIWLLISIFECDTCMTLVWEETMVDGDAVELSVNFDTHDLCYNVCVWHFQNYKLPLKTRLNDRKSKIQVQITAIYVWYA